MSVAQDRLPGGIAMGGEWRYQAHSKTQPAHFYADEGLPICGGGRIRRVTKALASASGARKYKVYRCSQCQALLTNPPGGGS